MTPCNFKDCVRDADRAPRVVLYFTDGAREWGVPAIFALPTCDTCRGRVTIERLISKQLIASIAAMRPGVIHTSSSLEWIELTHPDYIALKAASPS